MNEKIAIKYEGIKSFIKGSKAEAIKAGKPRPLVFVDMIKWRVKYGFDALDYQVYGFAKNWDPEIRKTFMSSNKWAEICNYVNALTPDKHFDLFKKSDVARTLKNYFKRDILVIEDASKDEIFGFIEKHPVFFAKQDESYAGIGVFKIDNSKFKNQMEIYLWLLDNHVVLLEESIIQHPELEKISPGCVGTLRFTTVVTPEEEVRFYSSLIRMGEGEVDRIISGQFYALVDDETGRIVKSAYKQDGDFNQRGGDFLDHHPFTGQELVGFQIPFYKEALEMVREMALKIKEYPFIGWDMAVSENGPMLLEANKFPANDIIQVYKYHPEEKGLYYDIVEALGIEDKF